MKKIIWIFLLLLWGVSVHSQKHNDYKKYNELMIKSEITTNQDSVIFYVESAIKVAKPFPEQLTSLSYLYFRRGDKVKSEKYILEAIAGGKKMEVDQGFAAIPFSIEYKDYISSDTTSACGKFLNSLYKEKKSAFLKQRKAYLKNIDPVHDAIYESMLQNENYFQSLRFLFFDEEVKDSIAFKYVAKYGPTPNSYYMLNLLRKGKFPERRKCARFDNSSIFMLLNHGIAGFLHKEDAVEFMALLWKQVEAGNLTPYEYAGAYDHYVHWHIDAYKSYFGTRMYRTSEGRVGLKDLIDPENVNEARKKHWLEPLDAFIENCNLIPPSNYGK